MVQQQRPGPSFSQWPKSIPSPGQDAEQDAKLFQATRVSTIPGHSAGSAMDESF